MELVVATLAGVLVTGTHYVYSRKPPPVIESDQHEEEYIEEVPNIPVTKSKLTPITVNSTRKSYHSINNGKQGKMEKFCREVIEEYYKLPFEKCSKFVKNPRTNSFLELDGYNSSLRLAFEYQGEQHYIYPNSWFKTYDQYEQQLWRDRVKRKACEKANIHLLVIPYSITTEWIVDKYGKRLPGKNRSMNEIKTIIEGELKKLNLKH